MLPYFRKSYITERSKIINTFKISHILIILIVLIRISGSLAIFKLLLSVELTHEKLENQYMFLYSILFQ